MKAERMFEIKMTVFCMSLSVLLGFFSIQTKAEREVNVATWGTPIQSTTAYGWIATNALDGSSSTCTHTQTQTDPWWMLDLMKTYSVNRVTITNRLSCCAERINGAEIRIGNNSLDLFSNPICATVSSIPGGATSSYSCAGLTGRYVIVDIRGLSMILTLCEVGVYVTFTGNLATDKTVTQSSTDTVWYAEQAIDFNPGFALAWPACSSTYSQTNPWWRLDLGSVYRVNRVVVTNRLDCCPERINGAEIHIGNSLENDGNNNPICAVISSIPAGASSTFTCNDMQGRYVNLFIPGDSKILTLCEVEVYGEGPVLKKTFVKLNLKSSSSLSEPAMIAQLLSQLRSALEERGFSDMTLQWTQPPKKEVMRKESSPAQCAARKR
ncbi:uncharacterized protein LOC122349004 isoform X1 [Puntigrus tetrazona]|uniref:uncharacterized protein LOC122349004 isoform X1 n=1 Tax=Puntigrus tetrazona TaxID=1606681 RepID=UPI001C89AD55|nr:uncharacterized protein LOC122349004 isoform X1 [Puntigrus tetrazona]